MSTLDTMKKPKAKGFTKYCTVRKHRGQLIRCRNQSRKKSIDVKKKSKRDKVHCKNKNSKSQTYFISVFIKIITSCDIVLCQTTKNIQPLGCKLDIHLKNTFEILEDLCVRIPAGLACRVHPVDDKLAPHPTDVQATSTKLYSVYGCKPVTHRYV